MDPCYSHARLVARPGGAFLWSGRSGPGKGHGCRPTTLAKGARVVLTEDYTLLQNAAICATLLSFAAAVALIENLRGNPAWLVFDHPGPGLMDKEW